MKAVLQLTPEDLEKIRQARQAFKDWQASDIESPECDKAFARWERLKMNLALLLINHAEGANDDHAHR